VAARLTAAAAAAAIAVALSGSCAAPSTGGAAAGDAGAPALPTAQQSLSPQVSATVAALRAQLGIAFPLVQLTRPYRPSEPESMQAAPRATLQVDLGAPDENYVVVYELTDLGTAAARGRELAAYLASGFGQTNYPPDAQFTLSQFGDTLVFAWWSPERSSAPQQARAAFELLSRFGQPIAVPK
jgi:hypothetical protein